MVEDRQPRSGFMWRGKGRPGRLPAQQAANATPRRWNAWVTMAATRSIRASASATTGSSLISKLCEYDKSWNLCR